MLRCLVAFLTISCFSLELGAQEKPRDVSVAELNSDKVRLLGKTHVPLGESITLQGRIISGSGKGYEGGPNLRVQRINGIATQEDIRLPLSPYWSDFGETPVNGIPLPKIKEGETFEFEGYETGGYVGRPSNAYIKAGVALQTSGHYFKIEFVVYKGKKIDPVVFAPSEFVERRALIKGKASNEKNQAWIEVAGERLLVDNAKPWPAALLAKDVEALGTIRKTDDMHKFQLDNGTARPQQLRDQVGQRVTLRGEVRGFNNQHWLRYRGADVYVEDFEKMPGWDPKQASVLLEVTGTLEEALLPAIEQLHKPQPELVKTFILRKPHGQHLDTLLSPELDDPELSGK